MPGDFREYLFPHDHPRLADVRGMDPYTYRDHARTPGTFTGNLVEGWTPLYLNDFRGITDDGVVREDVHRCVPAVGGERAPAEAMTAAAEEFLAALDASSREAVCFPVDAPEWQTWANPEFLQFDTGIRLEFQPPEVRQKALDLMAASLSAEGFELARNMMRINGFLGDVVGLPTVLGEFSYNIAIYGTPDPIEPWGWHVFGHHMAVNCLVVDGRMVIGPVFLGAEPNEIDAGPHRGVTAFEPRIRLGLQLMAELDPKQGSAATVYESMVDPAMPPGRIHPGDERHLAGAFQDNRVIPYEGIRVESMSPRAQASVLRIVEQFVGLLPEGPRAARMREVSEWLPETWFSWIGGHQPGDVFYYRIQSPVIVAELDHHCGVFLDYDTPKPFHIHTVLRTPNGNDYGRAFVRRWQSGIGRDGTGAA